MKRLIPTTATPWQHRRPVHPTVKPAQTLPPLVQRLLERVA